MGSANLGTNLLYESREDGHQHESSEHHVLHACLRRVCVVESETNEQASRNSEYEFRRNVAGHAPVLLEHAFGDFNELGRKRHGELVVGTLFACAGYLFVLLLLVKAIDVLIHHIEQVALLPNVVPVQSLVVVALVYNFQHVLGWILLIATLPGAAAFEIFQERL